LLCPHFFDVLQYHIGMPIESFHPCQQLLVVPQRDEDLGLVSDGLLQDGEWALGDLVVLELSNLGLVQLGFGNVCVLTHCGVVETKHSQPSKVAPPRQ